MNYKELYDKIISKIKSVRAKESGIILTSAVLLVAAVTILVVFLVSLLEAFAFGDEIFRSVLAGIIFLTCITTSFIWIYPAFIRFLGIRNLPKEEIIAERVGNFYPDINDKLRNSIELINELDTSVTSKDLAVAAFVDIAEQSLPKDFSVIIDRQKPRKTLYFFMATLLFAILCFTIFSSTLGASLYRIVNFSESFFPPAPFSLTVEPIKATVLKGSKYKITITAHGKAPLEVKLNIKEFSQENFDSYPLKLDSGNTYVYEISSAKNSIYYYASSEWINSEVESQLCTLKVTDKPIIKYMNGTINPPAYTKLPGRKFDEQNADISVLRGSSVSLELASNKNLQSAELIYFNSKSVADVENDSVPPTKETKKISKDSTIVRLEVDGKHARGSFHPSHNGEYYVKLTGKDGLTNDNRIHYNVFVTGDDYPSINLLEPYSDAQVSEEALLTTRVAISDDYGFSSLKLHYRLVESNYTLPMKNFASINVPISTQETTTELPYIWDLNKAGISPEDKYEFYFEVTDNDRVSGPKSAKTQVRTVRLPSLEEVLSQTNEAQKQIEKQMEKIAKATEDLKKESEELNREVLKKANNKQEMNWEDKKKAEELVKKQEDIQKKVDDIQKSLQDITQKLQENNVLSPETVQKYMELQKLIKEINSPEMRRLQEKMKQALDQMTPQQMQEALKNFKLDEEKFKQNIERTMKMLKRIQNEQKIDALNKKTEDLINKLDDLNKKLNNSNSSDKNKRDELANTQKQLNKDLNDIYKDLDDLEKSLNEMGKDAPKSAMQDAKQQLNKQETSQNMNSSEQNMQNGNYKQASQNQKSARQNLSNFRQSMQKMKSSMQSNLTKEAIKKMQKATNDMNQLSKAQEKLRNNSQNLDPNSSNYKNAATQQMEKMAALSNIVSSMFELSQKSFAVTPEMAKNMGNAMEAMQQAVTMLSDRNTYQAIKKQEQAMSAMNKSISQMQQMVARMKKTGSCSNPGGSGEGESGESGGMGGMQQQLQKIAAQQQAINQAMQQMSGTGGSGSLTPQQQAQMQKLSNQQGSARKTLEELSKEQKQYGGKKKALGSLEKIAQEMQEVATDMRQGNITPETRKKQDRILSRLLDATRSMTERDFEKERKARSGNDVTRRSPNDFDMSTQEGKQAAMKEFLQSVKQGYTKDYELIIKQYFESLSY